MTDPKPVSIDKILSPFGLKMIVLGSEKYGNAYKSYAFGLLHKVAAKWLYVLIAGVVVLVLVLYFTGTISFGR